LKYPPTVKLEGLLAMLGHFDIWIAGLASFGFVGRGKLMITNVSKEISVG